jgi:competence protein ComEA
LNASKGAGSARAVPARPAGAALALAGWLLALPLIRPVPPQPAGCPAPGELRAEAGHTVELACASLGAAAPVRGPARSLVGLPIDPNRADAATLETLPGVGPARALAILEARRERPFQRLEDLDRVPGIGPRILAGLAGWVGVAETPAAAPERPLAPLTPTR